MEGGTEACSDAVRAAAAVLARYARYQRYAPCVPWPRLHFGKKSQVAVVVLVTGMQCVMVRRPRSRMDSRMDSSGDMPGNIITISPPGPWGRRSAAPHFARRRAARAPFPPPPFPFTAALCFWLPAARRTPGALRWRAGVCLCGTRGAVQGGRGALEGGRGEQQVDLYYERQARQAKLGPGRAGLLGSGDAARRRPQSSGFV